MYIKRISSNTFRVWIDLPNDGTRNRPSKVFHATSKKDLTYQIEKWRDSISVIPSDCKTVNDLCLTVWEQVIADKAPNTIYGYNASLKRIQSTIGKTPIEKLSPRTIQTWINSLAKTLSPKTISDTYSILRICCSIAVKLNDTPFLPHHSTTTSCLY